MIVGSPVKNRRASDGEGHHDNEVGEEGEGAEDEVGLRSKAGFDDLHKQEDFSHSLWTLHPLGEVHSCLSCCYIEPMYQNIKKCFIGRAPKTFLRNPSVKFTELFYPKSTLRVGGYPLPGLRTEVEKFSTKIVIFHLKHCQRHNGPMG